MIVDSKSQPVELDKSTTELHVPSRRNGIACSHIVLFCGLLIPCSQPRPQGLLAFQLKIIEEKALGTRLPCSLMRFDDL